MRHASGDWRTGRRCRIATFSASARAAGSTRSTFAFAISSSGIEIAAAKSLDKVRELQADPVIGVNGQRLISADTPTNIFFFIASWRPVQE